MKFIYIIILSGSIFAASLPSSKSFDKIIAKQMSTKSDKNRYIVIRNERDLKRYNKYRDLCKDLKKNYSSKRGRKTNYISIKNVTINCSDASFGIKMDGYSSGSISNSVTIKNTKLEGGDINLGVNVKKYRDENINSDINNRVNILNSNVSGTFTQNIKKRGLNHLLNKKDK